MASTTADLEMGSAADPLLGLSAAEVAARRALGQINNARLGTSRSYLQILRHNVFTFINSVLFTLGFGLILLGRPSDAVATGGLVLINVVVGVVQEARAKRILDRIALLTRPRARVIRDGTESEIDPAEIVLGDLLVARAGDQVSVDGQVVGDGHMEMDESLLTGESDLVPKEAGAQVFSGSFCVNGSARYISQKIGAESFANQIAEGARAFRQVKTPLQRDVDYVVRILAFVVVVLGVLMITARVITPATLVEDVQMAAVLVSLVPQGLFFMVTLTYALGSVRMAGKGALIQQANAVESLSNVTVLCLDKTGTLTSGTIRLQEIKSLGMADGQLRQVLGDFVASGTAPNKTAAAIAAAQPGQKRGISQEIPFSSAWKWSSVAFADEPGAYVLGAPEILQPYLAADSDLGTTPGEWTAQGLRVLLFAHYGQAGALLDEQGTPKLLPDLRPLALLCFNDELRAEARATISGLAEAGVRIKVISGDSPETVAALAKQAGLADDVKLVSGLELDNLNDEEIEQIAEEGTIFGRITPKQKERLVRALRRKGYYTAMIGDGVNDVLSLKQAQLGIAMQSGSQAARAVADMVLLNDSFAAVPLAFREGQRIINGMQDVVRLLLTRTCYAALIISAAAIMGLPFPITPKYATLQTLLTVGIPTLALAAWARPGPPTRGLLRAVLHFIFPASFTVAIASLAVYIYYLSSTGNADLARTALTATSILCGLLLIVFVEPPSPLWVGGDVLSKDRRPTVVAVLMLLLFGVVMAVPALRDIFELQPLGLTDLGLIAAVVAVWAVALAVIWRQNLMEKLLRRPESADF